ncbi:protein-L-isoaspartate(D-aspartate) O-methyltransferase [Zeaxanthinibacter enoshimensis]|uniref:protein-L-isoaspartate(D-aspartate) O-methyltransferase n=1 Tax=Zeaxanthinibacter enoshimensis TaxID=392009 RepID=UPI00356AF03F
MRSLSLIIQHMVPAKRYAWDILRLALPLLLIQYGFSQETWNVARENMVVQQIESRGIKDAATLAAMRKVPRHLFVPENIRVVAYADRALSIGEGQTISQPYIVAFMTEAAQLGPGDKVLEIGTGSGYQAAVLGEIAAEVYTIEIVPGLGEQAAELLSDLGYKNVHVRIGDGYAGWPEQAPFDAILVTAGVTEVPDPLLQQLGEGGRMVIPVGPHNGVRQLTVISRKGNAFRKKRVMAVRFVPFTRH